MGLHVGPAGALFCVPRGSRRDAVAPLAAGVARPQAHLWPSRLAAPIRALCRTICKRKERKINKNNRKTNEHINKKKNE